MRKVFRCKKKENIANFLKKVDLVLKSLINQKRSKELQRKILHFGQSFHTFVVVKNTDNYLMDEIKLACIFLAFEDFVLLVLCFD